MKKLLALVVFAILLAPASWGIAINTPTRQCAAYWAGDEYFTYALPEGWQDYYPDENDRIDTPAGSCHWDRNNWDERAEKCCLALGYSYVPGEIGERRMGGLTLIMLAGLGLSLLVFLILCVGVLVVFALGVYLLRKLISK